MWFDCNKGNYQLEINDVDVCNTGQSLAFINKHTLYCRLQKGREGSNLIKCLTIKTYYIFVNKHVI